jgi:hypothetical protein
MMKYKTRKYVSLVFALALTIGLFGALLPLTVFGQSSTQTVYLKGTGNDFTEKWTNVFYCPQVEEKDIQDLSDPSVWHLVYTGDITKVTKMELKFTNGELFTWDPSMGVSTNPGGNNPGWVIVAPGGWELDYVNSGNNNKSDCFVETTEAQPGQFNISGHHKGTPTDPFVIPEYGLAGLAALLACFVALGVIAGAKLFKNRMNAKSFATGAVRSSL